MTRKAIKALAHRFKEALAERDIPVTAIYLFGSYAKGQPRPGSDIDFCVVSSRLGKNDFQEMVTLNQIGKRVAAEIEAFPVSDEDFVSRSNPFIAEALSKGTRLL